VSKLGYALLGLLARKSLSGYELTGQIKGRVAPFWSTTHSQVYPELSRLEDEGLVAHRLVEQSVRPDKKVYSITAEGQEALKEWVTSPVEPRTTRDELVLRAHNAWVADPREAAALFREHGRLHEERLSDYEEKREWMEREWGEDVRRANSPRFGSYAALLRGMIHERGYVEWCRWVGARRGWRGRCRDRSVETSPDGPWVASRRSSHSNNHRSQDHKVPKSRGGHQAALALAEASPCSRSVSSAAAATSGDCAPEAARHSAQHASACLHAREPSVRRRCLLWWSGHEQRHEPFASTR
jgi:PadR family transcriptional regulator, regulatory protein AphA